VARPTPDYTNAASASRLLTARKIVRRLTGKGTKQSAATLSSCKILDREWEPNLVEHFMNLIIKHIDIYKILYTIDPSAADRFKRQMEAMPHEHSHDHGTCSHKFHTIPLRDNMTQLESIAAEVTSRSHLYNILPRYVEQTAATFNNIKSKGIKDGLPFDKDMEKHLLEQVLTESVTRILVSEINTKYRKEEETTSKQPLLLAHPSGYREETNSELDILPGEKIAELMKDDYCIIDNFLH
jgi:hypothetical protein